MKYETYHETFHSIIDALTAATEKVGVVSSDFTNHMFTGGVGYGDNASYNFEIDTLKGRNTRKGLHLQVWRSESGQYEMNAYVL